MLVLRRVFKRRRNFVTSDLHVLLVTAAEAERKRMKDMMEGLHYQMTMASSGKVAQKMLSERGGEFHIAMVSVGLGDEGSAGLDCAGLFLWIRDQPALKEVALIALGSFSIEPSVVDLG